MKNDKWIGGNALVVEADSINGILIGDIIKTNFLDVWKKMSIPKIGLKIEVLDVDHYWFKCGLMLNATVNGKKIGIGVHPSFRADQRFVGSGNFYEEIEDIEFVFQTHGEMKKMRKQIKSQRLNRPLTKNKDRLKITDFSYKLRYSQSFYNEFIGEFVD